MRQSMLAKRYTGASKMPAEKVLSRLRLAAGLNIHTIPARQLWRGALLRSIGSDLSTHDTLFVELAVRKGLRLATFDGRVIRAFCSVAARPSTFR